MMPTRRQQNRIRRKCWRPSRSASGHLPLTAMRVPMIQVRTRQRRKQILLRLLVQSSSRQIVTEAPADDSEPVAPAPTLPSQAKVKRTANVVPTQGTAARKATPSSSKKEAKGNKKESDKPRELDDDDADKVTAQEDAAQVLGTQQKRNRAPAAHFDANPDASGKDQAKKKAKTAATAGAEFMPPSRSGAQPSCGTVASPRGTSTVARSLRSRLAKVAGPKKK